VTLIGLDGTAHHALEAETFEGPIALVMGAEGKGLRELTAATCTRLVKVSTADSLASLNVSNAAAIAMHTAFMKRKS
jgi:23S rRNA (guanosine2251-2'-O)-methyltransferase